MSDPRSPNSSFGVSLLDKSTAKPGSVDMSIFEKKTKPGQGTVSSDYLQATRADNPEPTEADDNGAVMLSGCKFTTAEEDIAAEKNFEAECNVKWTGSTAPKGLRITFDVHMTWDNDGIPEDEKSQAPFTVYLDESKSDQVVSLKGDLPWPPSFPPSGTKIKYKLVASHPDASDTSESDAIDVLLKESIHYVEVPDLHFALNGHFPCLDEGGSLLGAMVRTIEWAKANPEQQLVVFGHADTSGDFEINYDISDRRAQATVALVTHDGAAWERLAKHKVKVEEIQRCLKTLTTKHGWPCDPGDVDDQDGPATRNAVKAFQGICNDRYKLGLKEDGIVGSQTWKAVHRVICGLVAEALGTENPKNQAYPEWPLPDIVYQEGSGAYGCGESFPVKDVGVDGLVSEANRRVDLLFNAGWNFLEPVPDRTRALTKDECLPYGLEKVDWLALDGAARGSGSEPGYADVPVYERHFDNDNYLPNLADDEFLEAIAGVVEYFKQNKGKGECGIDSNSSVCSEDQPITSRRVQVAEAIVHGKTDVWGSLVKDATIADVQTFMKYFASKRWPCDPGKIDGLDGPKTKAGVRAFQQACNESWGMSLVVDGICGPKTWQGVLSTIRVLVGAESATASSPPHS